MPLLSLNNFMLLAAAQGFLLAVLIFHKHHHLKANRFLGAYMFIYSLILLNLILEDQGYFYRYPLLIFIHVALPFLVGPLHYWYARQLTNPGLNFRREDLLHFLPVIFFEGYFLSSYLLFPESILPADKTGEESIADIYLLYNWAILIQASFYMGLTIRLVRRYSRNIKRFFSAVEKIQLNWLENITAIVFAMLLIFLLENVLLLFDIKISNFFDVSSLLAAGSIYVMGYMSLSKSEIFASPEVVGSMEDFTKEAAEEESARKYEKSGLSEVKASAYEEKLLAEMTTEKLFAINNLTLNQLAERLEMTPHNLSEVINVRLGKNFFDFINEYRVEAVMAALRDPAQNHLTVLALGLDAGFNSKTAFNTIFKKHTGMTPSQYRREEQ